jgi:hypothetical protein
VNPYVDTDIDSFIVLEFLERNPRKIQAFGLKGALATALRVLLNGLVLQAIV